MIHFIRHAQSTYNKAQLKLVQKYGQTFSSTQQYLQMKFNLEYLDADLSQEGIKQALQASEKYRQIPIDCILVSPMRRTLRTSQILFKDKDCPKIVIPQFREIFESSCDIGNNLIQQMKCPQYNSYDFSRIVDAQKWYINTFNQPQRSQLMERSKQCGPIQAMIQFLKIWWQKRKTQQKLKEIVLSDIKVQKQILNQFLQKFNHIAVVTHSQTIKKYIGFKINNCQIYSYSADKLNS